MIDLVNRADLILRLKMVGSIPRRVRLTDFSAIFLSAEVPKISEREISFISRENCIQAL